jgi:hypothetical protein
VRSIPNASTTVTPAALEIGFFRLTTEIPSRIQSVDLGGVFAGDEVFEAMRGLLKALEEELVLYKAGRRASYLYDSAIFGQEVGCRTGSKMESPPKESIHFCIHSHLQKTCLCHGGVVLTERAAKIVRFTAGRDEAIARF